MSIARSIPGQIALLGLCCAAACATKPKSAPNTGMTSNNPATTANPGATAGSGGGPAAGAAAVGGGNTGGAGGTGATVGSTGGSGAAGAPAGAGGARMAAGGATGAAGAADMPGTGGTGSGTGGSTEVPQTCPATALSPGDSMGSVQVGGTTRSYILHVPASYTGQTPVPLVTDWHPILFDDAFEQSISGYQQKSDKEGFIVVFPNGIDNAWNIGDCCTTSRTVDDVGFARALVAQLEQQACIDPKRVYAVGYSMGGGMSYKLACDAGDLIAAIAPAAFQLMQDSEWPCRPSRPITVISTNGTADPVVPYAGGDVNPPNGLAVTNHFLGAVATLQRWAELDGCTDMPVDKGGGCQTYSQCNGGVEVTLCTVQGGGHTPADPEVTWATLKRFTLP